jgi:hypothetical protein
MSQKDILKEWFKELPSEEAPTDFSTKVMKHVMSEWTLNPIGYQPIISKKAWWMLGIMAFIITSVLFSLHSSLPGSSAMPDQTQTLLGINFSKLMTSFSLCIDKLNNISPVVAVGTFAVIALWFFDQLFSKAIRH